MIKRSTLILLSCLLTLAVCSPVSAEVDLREGFKARAPIIERLKNNGIIGETSNGYLDYVGSSRDGQEVVNNENRDRKIIYEQIGRKHGASPEMVGRRRAQQIRERAGAGHFLQDEGGRWRRK